MNNVKIIVGDITKQAVDAIVNAANEACLGGGGVDGAIHRAAGPDLLKACRKLPEVRPGVRCPTGEARITAAGNLPCRFVIHTVGPDCRRVMDVREQDRLLSSSYLRSLELAKENGLKSVAFPSISTGIFGFPLERAASVVARVVTKFLAANPDMSFTLCIFDPYASEEIRDAYTQAFTEIASTFSVGSKPLATRMSDDDMTFLEQTSLNLAFIMQRINRQLDTWNWPNPGTRALAGFRAIDYKKLTDLSLLDDTGRVAVLIKLHNAVTASERTGWKQRVFPEYWNGALYDKEHPEAATNYAKWSYVRPQVTSSPRGDGPVQGHDFPQVLTAEMLAGFEQTLNGSTCPHHGWIDGVHYIAKCARYTEPYGTSTDDHVHNEFLTDGFLRAAGLHVPESREYQVDFHDGKGPRVVRLARFIEGTRSLAEVVAEMGDKVAETLVEEVVRAYPIQAFIGGIDTYQNDNVLVDSSGELWYVDNGAAFDYRAQGGLKSPSWFSRCDIHDSRYGYLSLLRHSSQKLLQQIIRVESLVVDEARTFDFAALADLLPSSLKTDSVLKYASELMHFGEVM